MTAVSTWSTGGVVGADAGPLAPAGPAWSGIGALVLVVASPMAASWGAEPSDYSAADAHLVRLAQDALIAAGVSVQVGATWTTDAPFRETQEAINAAVTAEILAVAPPAYIRRGGTGAGSRSPGDLSGCSDRAGVAHDREEDPRAQPHGADRSGLGAGAGAHGEVLVH